MDVVLALTITTSYSKRYFFVTRALLYTQRKLSRIRLCYAADRFQYVFYTIKEQKEKTARDEDAENLLILTQQRILKKQNVSSVSENFSKAPFGGEFHAIFQFFFSLQLNYSSYVIVFSIVLASVAGQQFFNNYYEDTHNSFNSKGVCTINGEVFYGIDCWCYSNKVGTVFFTILIVLLIVYFLINGCIWACIIRCYQSFRGRGSDDDDFRDIGSLRSSIRTRSSMRKSQDIETPIN